MTTKHPPKQAKPLRKPALGDEGVYGHGPAYREQIKNWESGRDDRSRDPS
jgi:hypothetical protein